MLYGSTSNEYWVIDYWVIESTSMTGWQLAFAVSRRKLKRIIVLGSCCSSELVNDDEPWTSYILILYLDVIIMILYGNMVDINPLTLLNLSLVIGVGGVALEDYQLW